MYKECGIKRYKRMSTEKTDLEYKKDHIRLMKTVRNNKPYQKRKF